jgi:predicted ATP-grasp superfamily ATP-dependent carboligase
MKITKKYGAVIIEGHVQGLSNTRSLGEWGIPVVVLDTDDCVARYSKYCWRYYKCPPYFSDALADFLIGLAKKQELKKWLLLPSNDHAVLTIARNKERLEQYFKVITPELNVVENIYDKSRLLSIAEKVGVPYPKTFYAHDFNPTDVFLSFPVLTRGRFGLDFYKAMGRKAFLANDIEELRKQLFFINKRFPVQKTLTQELIPDYETNKTISFTAFCLDGEIKAFWMGEKLREHPVRFGTATFAKSVYMKGCYTQSVPLLKELNYTGVCELEYLHDPRDGHYKLIEINARTWLWVGLAKACGVDFARMAYAHVNGIDTVYPNQYEIDVYWINPVTDAVYAAKEIFKGHINIFSYIGSLLNSKKVNALFTKKDWKPSIVYCFSIFRFIKKR